MCLQTDVWPQIYASPDEMTRLFQNLIGNALKYHRPDQHPVVRIGVEAMPEHWRFYVEPESF
ncbi:hypothetical protein [Nitrincola tapanii]|uniref:HAMP domain-containing histidine kinase n=1 Tax=Nitrincola tapanii TaxID=1708751 RepID=A0A5A9W580_9GAMM|nr:hypothetical protein [Nitrincola tapanii]KAA0875926.1 HAMP domain-containing histidine kinase [Nitrincola tapanii]